ncbi:MAG: homoserine dehydrogenase [Segniliparus sp.]|uniref:homoserine dehydrogenase n=1 Tax=Segniliparus sp. TaxID=2804064 RepID=UPI003F332816
MANNEDRETREIGVGLLGLGVVGSEVARILIEDAEELAARVGARLVLRGVAVRKLDAERPAASRLVDPALLTTDAQALVARPDVDVVVELIGGINPAKDLIRQALRAGKSVVSANKALFAAHSAKLFEAAQKAKVDLFFEAAVAGAIPVIRPLKQSLAGDRITAVAGIVNGTTNFILSAMDSEGKDYADVLKQAQALGYAEADPTADVGGHDAAAKTAIMASIAFHTRVTADDVHVEGITEISAADIESAKQLGYAIKLLSLSERVVGEDDKERVSARVYPALVPRSHPLASVNGAYNAVVVEAVNAGRLMFYGQGAGGAPTASSVAGDLVAAARNVVLGRAVASESTYAKLPIAPIGDVAARYFVRMRVDDRPGVLASVADMFAKRDVSIATVFQKGVTDHDGGPGGGAEIIIITHSALGRALAETVRDVEKLPAVIEVESVLRLEFEND